MDRRGFFLGFHWPQLFCFQYTTCTSVTSVTMGTLVNYMTTHNIHFSAGARKHTRTHTRTHAHTHTHTLTHPPHTHTFNHTELTSFIIAVAAVRISLALGISAGKLGRLSWSRARSIFGLHKNKQQREHFEYLRPTQKQTTEGTLWVSSTYTKTNNRGNTLSIFDLHKNKQQREHFEYLRPTQKQTAEGTLSCELTHVLLSMCHSSPSNVEVLITADRLGQYDCKIKLASDYFRSESF